MDSLNTACAPVNYSWRQANPGRILINALQRFEGQVMQLMAEAGYEKTRRSHINLTRHLDLEGTRITELAKRATMTNAAMTELVNQCIALGLVERLSDPSDGRVRIVRFTGEGRLWLDAFSLAIATAQQSMAEEIGEQGMRFLFNELAQYGNQSSNSI